MTDYAIKGSSILHRLAPEPSGGSGLVSSRFLVRPGPGGDGDPAEHNTGGIADDSNVPIKWDTTPEFDNIGFPTDYATTGGFFTAEEAEYHIDVYVEIAADTAFDGPGIGEMLVSIETGGSLVNSYQACPVLTGTTPRAQVSDTYHFAGGFFGSFEVHVYLNSTGDSATVTRASVTITKLS